jgi:hypothetical protein
MCSIRSSTARGLLPRRAQQFCIATTCLGLFVVATHLRPVLEVPARHDAGSVPTLLVTHGDVEVKNKSWFLPFVVSSVTTSCGCTEVVDFPRTIGPRQVARIKLRFVPRVLDKHLDADVVIAPVEGWCSKAKFRVSGDVVAPFRGWPDRIEIEQSDRGYWRARVSPLHRGIFTDVMIRLPSGETQRGVVDDHSDEIWLFADLPRVSGNLEVVLAVASDVATQWRGWVHFERRQ